jgi:hypothetical protein
MDIFYIIVGSIATVILILMLTYIGIQMTKNQSSTANNVYPPNKSTCPDYWKVSTDLSYCIIPAAKSRNVGSIYNSTGANTISNAGAMVPGYNANKNSISFSDAGWGANGTSTCNQKKFANTFGVYWDGVSNYNGC